MILLIVFALLAGIVTILSPCILPVLPIILSSTVGGKESGKSRPIGVIIGFVVSFTFFTLFLSLIVQLSRIPADSLRFTSIIVIAGFGLSLLFPQFQSVIEKLSSRLTQYVPRSKGKTGFAPGFLIGLSLGLLWTPCVGPILASVIALAITGTVTLNAFIITFAYSLGTAIPMFLIMIGGQNILRKVPWLVARTAVIQKAFGILMILTAFGIFTNADRAFQTFILKKFPQYGVGLTQFEDNEKVREKLKNLYGKDVSNEMIGKPSFNLLQPQGTKAPEIIPGGVWFNLPIDGIGNAPLTLEQLKGKVVLLDFWTYSCINCQRTFPYLRKWWDTYKDKGLVIIGVHSPEFEFEKNEHNVQKAISDFKLTYPIVQDNNFATWRAYDNHYWPAKYFIDKEGYIRYVHFGEGAYDASEKVIQTLLKETGVKDIPIDINNPSYQTYAKTPETYLGYARITGFSSSERIVPDTLSLYSPPQSLFDNTVAFEGIWRMTKEYANPQKNARLYFNFESKDVFLVMRPSKKSARVKIFIDDVMQYFGEDNKKGIVTVDEDRLYRLITLPTSERHMLKLEFEDSNAQLF